MDVNSNKILVGGIPAYFDPFVDNEIDLDADAIPASKILSNNTVTNFSSHKPIGASPGRDYVLTGMVLQII